MCGRFTITLIVGLAERFGIQELSIEIFPRYNIAPSQPAPIIIHPAGSGRLAVEMTWGLVPGWDFSGKKVKPLINARAETLAHLPLFRDALVSRRCIIPADGFYEWAHMGKEKVPYYIRRKDSALFGFAGLYSGTNAPDGTAVQTFTIITTQPDDVVARLHGRMPAILREGDESVWLNTGVLGEEELQRILSPYPPGLLESYPVSSRVNDPTIEGESLIKRIEGQQSLFS